MRSPTPAGIRRSFLSSWLLLSAALPAGVAAEPLAPHERLTHLAEEVIETTAKAHPLLATELGLTAYDAELPIPTEASRAEEIERLRGWVWQVDAIEQSTPHLGLVDRDDAKLLRAQLAGDLAELLVRRADRKDYAGAAQGVVNGLFTQFLNLPVAGVDGAAPADLDRAWSDIVSRLEKAPAFIAAGQALATEPGRLQGQVGSESLAGAPDFLGGALTDAAKVQVASQPALLHRFTAGRDALLGVLSQTKAYLDAHDRSWPENYAMGAAAYDEMLRTEELLPYTSADIEVMARDELAHGWAEEAWLQSVAKLRGTPFGPVTGGGLAPGGPALVDYYRQRISELRRFVTEHDVVTIPAWLGSMQIVETPKFLQPVSPGASMNSPRLFSKSMTGFYFITPPVSLADAAARLDMNEDFDRDRIWSTGAHEAMPGHFLQLSIAKRNPDYVRRIQNSAVFEEGWAYYGEEMFVRLGMYGDDLDGRLFTARWERVRGARAVVDPKLASGEWTVDQAVAFFEAQSGFTHDASVEAVHGFALQPGYVIAYTAGRLQLETLLADYLQRTGGQGSLHDFHDRLLSYGSCPFAVVGPELLADLGKPAAAVRAAANY